MQAAFITHTGAPSVLQYGELPTPTPGPGEVLVQVKAAALNPIDTYIRSGAIPMAQKFPYISGCDLAGVVTAVGTGTSRYKVGDRVWGSNQSLFGRAGTFAEFDAVHEDWLYPTPANQSDESAAAGALTGITAHLGLFLHAQLQPGEVVFVNGGTGGVGSAVIQIAKAAGAKVIATAGTPQKLDQCRALGADLAVNYKASEMDDTIKAFTQTHGGIHIWFETLREPSLDRTITLMSPRGRFLAMAGRAVRPEFPWGPFYVKELRLIGFAMFNGTPAEQRECGLALNALFERGQWNPPIGKVFPLSEAAAAHALQEANTLDKQGTLSGKIVVVP